MKRIYLIIALLLPLVLGGCSDDENSGEINFGEGDPVIEKNIDGMELKFCLLNEKGKPANAFKEGENFYFYFSIKNNSKQDYYHYYRDCAYINDFLRIYDESDLDIGKSYKPLIPTALGIGAYPFNKGDVFIFRVPWLHKVHDEESIFSGGDYHYQSIYREPLSKGSYHTGFKHRFVFSNGPEIIDTDSLNFNINFNIQ